MKKLLLLACVVGLAISGQAQNRLRNDEPRFKSLDRSDINTSRFFRAKRRALTSDWYFPLSVGTNISGFIEGAAPSPFTNYISFMWPDSTVKVISSDGNGGYSSYNVYQHYVGNAISPIDPNIIYQDPPVPVFNTHMKYTMDSIGIRYGYYREVDSAIVNLKKVKVVDTLILEFIKSDQLNFGGLAGGEKFAQPTKANFNLTKLGISNPTVIKKIPLTEKDSSSYSSTGFFTKLVEYEVGLNNDQPNSNSNLKTVIFFGMKFKPMLPYAKGDTLYSANPKDKIKKKSNFFVYYYKVNALDTASQVKQYSYYNNSIFCTKQVRYGQTANGWTSYFPGNAYFQHQYLFAYYKLSSNQLSAPKIDAKGYGLGEAYPNPAMNGTEVTFNFSLGNSSKATLSISDLSGKKVMEVANGDFVGGSNKVTVNIGSLKAGIYTYTLTSDNYTETKKLIVQ